MSANEKPTNKLLKLEDVLERIPVSKATWYRIIEKEKDKNLKPIKIGRGSFWKKDAIDNYIDSL